MTLKVGDEEDRITGSVEDKTLTRQVWLDCRGGYYQNPKEAVALQPPWELPG